MAVVPYLNRPDFVFGLSVSDPNDPAALYAWTDLTTSLKSVADYQRGKEYQLGQGLAANPTIVLRDVSENLNQNNPSSPFAPNVVPYRSVLWMGMWPNNGAAGVGAGNLLNSGAWRGNKETAWDPTFDSLTLNSFPTWMRMGGSVNPAAHVSTLTPFAGTQSLAWSVNAGAINQSVTVLVRCMPGRVYTFSGYVRQSAANNIVCTVDASSSTSTNTSSSGFYVRLSTQFTATATVHRVSFTTGSTITSGTNNLDSIMMECGAVTPSAFTTSGPVIYPIFQLLVRAFGRQYADNGYTGYSVMDAVDQLAALAAIRIPTDYIAALLALAPDYYWPLSNTSGALPPGPSGAANAPSMTYVSSKSGSGAGVTPGSAIAIAGDPGAVGAFFPGSQSEPLQGLGVGITKGGRPVPTGLSFPASTATPWGLSFAAWVSCDPRMAAAYPPVQNGEVVILEGGQLTQNRPLEIVVSVTGTNAGQVFLGCTIDTGAGASCVWPGFIADGVSRLLTGTVSQDATNTIVTLYVNGAQVATSTVATSTAGALVHPATAVLLGAVFAAFPGQSFMASNFYGVIARPAIWQRALSPAEVAGLYTGGTGNPGEPVGTRIARHIASGGYAGPLRISTGTTTLGPPTFQGTTDLLTDSTGNSAVDLGTFWAAPDGAVVFEGRSDRFLRLSSQTTISQTQNQYLPDIQLSTDDQYLYVDVQVTRNGSGGTRYGGSQAAIAAARLRFFGQPFSLSGDLADDGQAQTLADWIFYTHNSAVQRVSAVTLDMASNPGLWALGLSAEIGQRWTFALSTPAANGGAGLTNSFDAFVEQVGFPSFDADTGEATIVLWLSAIGAGTPQNQQPWILGDSTWGVLGSTTKLAP